jgi:SHS2 domain-containing protein
MPADAPAWFREIDHTGDIGIQVTAPTLPQLF